MRECIVLSLILAIIAPSIVPWLPHDALHAVHDTHMAYHHLGSGQASHHGYHNEHDHQHAAYDHHAHVEEPDHHPIQIDAISYFSDYLHLDLQQPNDIDFSITDLPGKVFSGFAINSFFSLNTHLDSVQNRGPPLNFKRHVKTTSLPVYFATQRFRV